MSDPLESSKYMLARAKHHIADFKAQSMAYLESRPYAVIEERDTKTGENVVKMRLTKPTPIMLNGIASDVAVNLRSALDQCGYAVSVVNGGRGRNTYFPFHDELSGVLGAKRGGSAEIPDEIFSLMTAFKPYKGGNDLLWSLNKLSNTNKHRIVSPVAMRSGSATVNAEVNGINLRVPTTFKWSRKNNDLEIARYTGKGSIKYDFELTVFIAFNDPEPATRDSAEAIMDALARKVDCILMAVEAESRRIGLFK